MNRREFTASLAALATTPFLPFGTVSATTAPVAAIPPGSYAWAQLIARAQSNCSPAMLARHLHLDTQTATHLFETMVRDGVLRAPTAAGIAQATHPIEATGTRTQSLTTKLRARLRKNLRTGRRDASNARDETTPLVKADDPALGYREIMAEVDPDARTNQSVQESPKIR